MFVEKAIVSSDAISDVLRHEDFLVVLRLYLPVFLCLLPFQVLPQILVTVKELVKVMLREISCVLDDSSHGRVKTKVPFCANMASLFTPILVITITGRLWCSLFRVIMPLLGGLVKYELGIAVGELCWSTHIKMHLLLIR